MARKAIWLATGVGMLRKPVPTGKGFRDSGQREGWGIAIGFTSAIATVAAVVVCGRIEKVGLAAIIGIGGIVGFSVPSRNYLIRAVAFGDPILVIAGFYVGLAFQAVVLF
jgi:hypothetical protein